MPSIVFPGTVRFLLTPLWSGRGAESLTPGSSPGTKLRPQVKTAPGIRGTGSHLGGCDHDVRHLGAGVLRLVPGRAHLQVGDAIDDHGHSVGRLGVYDGADHRGGDGPDRRDRGRGRERVVIMIIIHIDVDAAIHVHVAD